MSKFKVGDQVTWKDFVGLPEQAQVGLLWDGPAINPKGYRVIGVSGMVLQVETKGGGRFFEGADRFLKLKSFRNLPDWW